MLPDNTTITGNIFYRDRDLLQLSNKQLIGIRGKEIGLLPQSPSTSLNPVLKIGEQISEGLRLHKNLNRSIAWQKTLEILQLLGLPSAEKRINAYPHQLSGGMKQRILAAISITGQPSLLIADEPTKGLDAVLRAQVVEILRRMIRETGASLLLITHDLKVAARLCDDIVVMYAGEIVERAPAAHILAKPRHPYTQGLMASMPEGGLRPIPGHSPSLLNQSVGCNFYQRCRRLNGDGICEKNGEQLKVDLIVGQSWNFREKKIAEACQAQLGQAGFSVEVKQLEAAAVAVLEKEKNFNMLIRTGYFVWGPYPHHVKMHSSKNYTSHYNNPVYDQLVLKGESTTNEEQKQQIYTDIQKMILSELPAFYLVHEEKIVATRNNVQGYKITAEDPWLELRGVSLNK